MLLLWTPRKAKWFPRNPNFNGSYCPKPVWQSAPPREHNEKCWEERSSAATAGGAQGGYGFMDGTHIKVVALNGSARKGGNTAILLGYVLKELEKEGIETELIEMSGAKIHGCLACRECSRKKDHRCSQANDMGNAYIEKMEQADGILLGSPTYVTDVTPEIKALIDRACMVSGANGGIFRRKVGAGVVVARREGAIHAFDTLNHFFFITEMIVPGSSYWNIGVGREIGDVEKDEEGLRIMKTLGQNMAWLLKKVKK
jgi:multimeric flavodoxin WrbA